MEMYSTNQRKRRNRARQRRIRRIKAIAALSFMILLVVALVAGITIIVKQNKGSGKNGIVKNQGTGESENVETTDFSLVSKEGFEVSDFYYYGTHFNFTATMPYVLEEGTTLKRVSVRVYKLSDISLSSAVTETNVKYSLKDDVMTVKAGETIDAGVSLEQIPEGEFVVLMAIRDNLDNTYLYPLKDASGNKDLVYYTITKNETNLKIDIKNETLKDDKNISLTSFVMSSKECTLPSDVYDIIIDPGHGTCDGGAESAEDYLDENGKKYNEREIALQYAKELKKTLEDMGYKVQLTRDGSEGTSSDAWCYWNAFRDAKDGEKFKDGGRVWRICESKAKYCISLHMNVGEGMKRVRGVEVYSSVRASTRFAEILVDYITSNTGMQASGQTFNALSNNPGVYKYRSNDDPNTDYLYILRETAGTVTGAYVVDNQKLGTNIHYQDNYGPEGYLIEMGYIKDKENLDIILGQKSKYIKAIADSFKKDIDNMQGVVEN